MFAFYSPICQAVADAGFAIHYGVLRSLRQPCLCRKLGS